MRRDLILLFKPLIRGRIAGESAPAGGPRLPFPYQGKGSLVCDHIWLIRGVSECKWSECERAWYLRTGGIYQDSLLTDVRMIALCTFDT